MSLATEIQRIQGAKADIKTAIENKGVTVGDGRIDTYAEKISQISSGGGDSYYDTFWDNFQTNGNRTSYNYAFAGEGWNNVTFKPKYPINAVGDASYMFDNCALSNFDFIEKAKELFGVDEDGNPKEQLLNTSGVTSMTYCFRSANIKHYGVIDCTNCKEANRLFYGSKVEIIDELIVHENLKFTNAFDYTGSLVNITIKGVIAQNGFKITSSGLSKASIISIINALSTTTSGLTVTLSKTAINTAFGINVDDTSTWPEGSEYYTLRHSKDNWTFSYS